jgi:hypothetical protein
MQDELRTASTMACCQESPGTSNSSVHSKKASAAALAPPP